MRAKEKWDNNCEHDYLLAFWLAVDKEDIRTANMLMNYDPALRYIATLALRRKKEYKGAAKNKSRKRDKDSASQTKEREKEPD